MKPGRELDALVAEKVMGFRHYISSEWKGLVRTEGQISQIEMHAKFDEPISPLKFVPPYSTAIEAAWEVIQECIRVRKEFKLEWRREPDEGWECSLELFDKIYDGPYNFTATSESAPHAICLAALKLVESQK